MVATRQKAFATFGAPRAVARWRTCELVGGSGPGGPFQTHTDDNFDYFALRTLLYSLRFTC
jgi:hypothetical protein